MAKHERIDDRHDAQEDTVDASDGQVPGPRRVLPGRFHRLPAAAELTGLLPGEETPRVAELHALLGDIDALRLTLQTDLTLAAAAVEGGVQDLAAELVDSDLAELHAFSRRAAAHLTRLEEGAPSDDTAVADELPVQIPVRRRRVLSGAPLMAAAAALIGFVAFVPSRGASTPETTMTSAAMAGYELTRLASEGAPDEQLRLAAEELNDELAALIARAGDDPAAARQALLLLEQTTQVLSRQGDSGVLRSVMAETQALRARLRQALPVVAQRPARAGRPALRVVTPQAPRIAVEPEKERTSSSPSAQSSPKPSPSPSSPPPSPSPSPQPTAEQSPSGEEPPGPLGAGEGGGTLPGI